MSQVRRPWPWFAAAGLLLAGSSLAAGLILWLRPAPSASPRIEPGEAQVRRAVAVPNVRFTDITAAAGIRFRHTNGSTGHKLLPETMGSGVAFLDYDNDGKQDLLFVNSCPWPHGKATGPAPTLALYRNKGDGTFEDVTAEAGLAVSFFGMGVTAGDYDNDGHIDLFFTAVGGNRLFHNDAGPGGRRRFREVTARAGVGGPGGWPDRPDPRFHERETPLSFPSSAAFLDYDGDGRLDLFVCNYVTWSPNVDLRQGFRLTGVGRAFGPPTAFEGTQCVLYHNRGDGTFEDVSAAAGVQVVEREGTGPEARPRAMAKSLGVTVADVDGDGWPDVFVANDTVRNFFFHNVPSSDGSRHFEEIGLPAGIAYAEGRARGAMGSDWAPWYRPGRSLLAIGNFANEPNTLLCVDDPSSLQFSDVALAEGVAGPSRSLLKFGLFFFDYDLDGRPDLLTCNGHLEPEIGVVQRGQSYAQPAQLFWNTGARPRGFEPVTAEAAGRDLFRPLVGRGCAFADINGDGNLDVVLTANGGSPRLLRNEGGTGNHWLRLRLEGDGRRSNRSALGARVRLEAGGQEQWRELTGSRGYLSESELVLTFGLGQTTRADRVTVYWPGKKVSAQTLENLTADREHLVRQAE